jgi:hypothetical protein
MHRGEIKPAYNYNLGDLYLIDVNTCVFATSVLLAFRVNGDLRRTAMTHRTFQRLDICLVLWLVDGSGFQSCSL